MWATIVAAVIGIAGTAISTGVNAKNQREAKKEAKELAAIARQDELGRQSREFGLAEDKLNLEKEAVGMNNVKSNFEMAQVRKATKVSQLGTLTNALNVNATKDQNMTNFILSLYNKTGIAK